ncbi:MAG: hypothetical protein IPL75_11985 [Acidobacteria bacterium]|nr:hypothetical protein [Acidobacteriota bacterium]
MELPAAARQAMARLAADLTRVFSDRFVALVAYGPTRTAAFARSIHADDLDALTPLADRWQREGLDTPLLITPLEFERSLDAFPLEYQALLDRHEVIAGESPFTNARPSEADLRRACEVQAKAFLIHLRQGWIQAAGHAHEQELLLAESAAPLRALLASVAQLQHASHATDADIAAFAGQATGVPADLVAGILALEQHPEAAGRLTSRLGEYLGVAERLWAHVDGWRA